MIRKIAIISTIMFILAIIFAQFWFNQIYARKLIVAIEANDVKKIEKLVSEGGNINSKPYFTDWFSEISETSNQQPIFYACRSSNVQILRLLVNNGANVNIFLDHKCEYPLFYVLKTASPQERYEMALCLLENNFDLQRVKAMDENFLWHIFLVGSEGLDTNQDGVGENSLAKIDFEYELFIAILNYYFDSLSNSPIYPEGNFLHTTSKWGNLQIAKYLVENLNYDINALGTLEQTALIKSVIFGSTNVAQYLIECGADTQIMDEFGKTALDYAIEKQRTSLIELL